MICIVFTKIRNYIHLGLGKPWGLCVMIVKTADNNSQWCKCIYSTYIYIYHIIYDTCITPNNTNNTNSTNNDNMAPPIIHNHSGTQIMTCAYFSFSSPYRASPQNGGSKLNILPIVQPFCMRKITKTVEQLPTKIHEILMFPLFTQPSWSVHWSRRDVTKSLDTQNLDRNFMEICDA